MLYSLTGAQNFYRKVSQSFTRSFAKYFIIMCNIMVKKRFAKNFKKNLCESVLSLKFVG